MGRNSIRILHVVGFMGYGGIENTLVQLLRYFHPREYQFDCCTCWPRPGVYDAEVERLGSRIIPCPVRPNWLTFPRRFRRLLREGRYDVVHSHVEWFSGMILREAKAEGVPLRIAHMHTTHDVRPPTVRRRLFLALMERWVRQYATEGLACSASAAEVLFGADWQSDPRIHVLHSGIDLEPFRQAGSREAVRQELGIPPDVPVVGHVGRVAKQKNHDFLLQIAVEFLKLEPQARFLVVGDGPERVRIESMAHEMGLRGKVIFAGGRSDVPRLMLGAMDVFVLPSLWEGLARVLIEAQASGLRCVTTNTVPTEAAVVPGALELVSLAAGPHEWAARVHGALMRGRLAQAEALQALAQSDFTIEKTVAALKRLYDQARLITRTA